MSISISQLCFDWPDGTAVFDNLSLTVDHGRHGLIGANGSGKSTLLRLITGELGPDTGAVTVDGVLGYVPQQADTRSDQTVEETLELDLAWPQAILGKLGLSHIAPDRPISTLSGGERVLLMIAAKLAAEPDILVLDEPSNNLDRRARQYLYGVVRSWPGTLIVASHDRELLNLMDDIGELRDGKIGWFGGNFDAYERLVATEQEAAERTARTATGEVRRQRRDLAEAHTKLERRERYGRKMNSQKREPKIVMGGRKSSAQVAAGKHHNMQVNRLEDARQLLTSAQENVRDDQRIRIELPHTSVPSGRQVFTLRGVRLPHRAEAMELAVRGPERIGLTGRNGSGKTTLLKMLTGQLQPVRGDVQVQVPTRFLPQSIDILDPALTITANARLLAPRSNENEIRSALARFLFRGARADQLVQTLSGGELLRASLACLLLAEPAPQLLLLDEPTNNLDLDSVRQLREALTAYEGALIVVSHDARFLEEIHLTRIVELG